MASYAWFDSVLEWYTPPSDFATAPISAWDAGGTPRKGYVSTQDFHEGFREREFPIEELWALEKTLKVISIPLGSSVGAFHGGSGLTRIYHVREGWIDFFYRNIEQPQWNPLLEFTNGRKMGSNRSALSKTPFKRPQIRTSTPRLARYRKSGQNGKKGRGIGKKEMKLPLRSMSV